MNRRDAFAAIHFPDSPEAQKKAEFRLKFEELFYIQLRLLSMKQAGSRNFVVASSPRSATISTASSGMPAVPLTNAQKARHQEIRTDCGSGSR